MEIVEKAPAKINLGLDTLYKREDGYHELRTIMASVDLADKLIFRERQDQAFILTTDSGFLPVDERNLISQVVSLLRSRFQIESGLEIHVSKRIPVAAGLAGGSSDAAATLRGLNRLWQLNLSIEELAVLGAEIGSDVPYCLWGHTALVEGRGEIITALPPLPQCWVVLVKPKLSVSSRKIFEVLDVDQVAHPDIDRLENSIRQGSYPEMVASLGNSLESITISKHPVVQQVKDKMIKFGADGAMMSGSGPTVFALCEHYSRAQRVFNGLKGFCEEVYLVRTIKK